jgi:hypothetical protein
MGFDEPHPSHERSSATCLSKSGHVRYKGRSLQDAFINTDDHIIQAL